MIETVSKLLKKLKFWQTLTLQKIIIFIEQNEIDKGEFKKFRTKILANLCEVLPIS